MEQIKSSMRQKRRLPAPSYVSLFQHPFDKRLLINDDIDAIIHRGEERTSELNSKYEGLNLEDLSNFKSEASVQQWEGEDFRTGVSHILSIAP